MELVDNKIYFIVKEYEMLKGEQNKRIEFRDHMIYITLGVIGGVFSFILEKPEYNTALLVLPFVCIILGWAYLTNDEKVSEIGNYIRESILPKIESSKSDSALSVLPSWEDFHRTTGQNQHKKKIQLSLDILLFCVSPIFSIFLFFDINIGVNWIQVIFAIIEVLLVFYLVFKFINAVQINE